MTPITSAGQARMAHDESRRCGAGKRGVRRAGALIVLSGHRPESAHSGGMSGLTRLGEPLSTLCIPPGTLCAPLSSG